VAIRSGALSTSVPSRSKTTVGVAIIRESLPAERRDGKGTSRARPRQMDYAPRGIGASVDCEVPKPSRHPPIRANFESTWH